MPKYKDDVCSGSGFGLIPVLNVNSLQKIIHVTLIIYLGDCVGKLWKIQHAQIQLPWKTPDDLGKVIRMSYKERNNNEIQML